MSRIVRFRATGNTSTVPYFRLIDTGSVPVHLTPSWLGPHTHGERTVAVLIGAGFGFGAASAGVEAPARHAAASERAMRRFFISIL
ncbi:MAG: hypothetical protein GX427_06460 [Actinomycetales bacterium]|nr:hypothetical protein [Actinomycetales bacterium]